MIQKWPQIKRRLNGAMKSDDPLFIIPTPNAKKGDSKENDAASVDLRLGTWFLVSRQTKVSLLEVPELSTTALRLEQFPEKNNVDIEVYKKLTSHLCPK